MQALLAELDSKRDIWEGHHQLPQAKPRAGRCDAHDARLDNVQKGISVLLIVRGLC